MASVTQSTYEDGKTYQDIINKMNQAGIKTTSIRQGREADFEDYGNALSTEVKKMLLDSFDCEQDYVLQQQLAGLFSGRHDIKNGDLIKACKAMGLQISRSSVKTSYISDYKGGNFSNSVRNGSISVFTISDGKGGEIKIADTNGNGAIESEELFMNQILGDINKDIAQISPQLIGAGSSSASGGLSSIVGSKDVSQEDFNKKVEEYLNSNSDTTLKEAELRANISLSSLGMSYTGAMIDKKEDKVSQEDYNAKVEQYLQNKTDISEAQLKADQFFGNTTYIYTGSKKDKTVSQDIFNNKVSELYRENQNINESVDKTAKEFGVFDMSFTGSVSDIKKKMHEEELEKQISKK